MLDHPKLPFHIVRKTLGHVHAWNTDIGKLCFYYSLVVISKVAEVLWSIRITFVVGVGLLAKGQVESCESSVVVKM